MSWNNNQYEFSKKNKSDNFLFSSQKTSEFFVSLVSDELRESFEYLENSRHSVEISSKTENYGSA